MSKGKGGTEIDPGSDEREPVFFISSRRGRLGVDFRELWAYRDLLYMLALRDISVRYKQTLLGAAWAVIQPLLTMLIFTLVFGMIAQVRSEGVPYPVFAFAGLLPWLFFAQTLSRGGGSLVGNANLISKVYFPRLIVPMATTVAPLVDFLIAFVFLLVIMVFYGIVPGRRLLALPLLLGLATATALACGLWLSALDVRYRDVGHVIPFLVQIWMFVSPVAYPSQLVPLRLQSVYALNPMAGVIEGVRWSLLGTPGPDLRFLALNVVCVLVVLLGGIAFFHRTEDTLVDVI